MAALDRDIRTAEPGARHPAARRLERVRVTAIKPGYERVKRGDCERRKIALVATAHYLLRVMLTMLQTGEVWRNESQAA